MKVVKLNRRFKMFKEHGHTVALRFNNYMESQAYERTCKEKFGSSWTPTYSNWYSYFGDRSGRNNVRPYWISFRNEMDLTLVLLSVDLTK